MLFFQNGFLVTRTSSSELSVNQGLGFQDVVTNSYDPQRKPLVLDSDASVSIDTPDASNDRIDIISVKYNRFNAESEDRNFKDEFTDTITQQATTVATDWKADVLYTAGVPGASPVAPSTPSGYIKIAEVVVTASTGIAASGAITDSRSKLPVAGKVSDTGSSEYDAIVGTLGIDEGATYSTLKAALDNASAGWKILVLRDEIISSIPVVGEDNIEIVFKRGVTFTKGTSIKGLQIDGDDCKVINGRFKDFDTASDYGIHVNSAARTYLDACRFNNCDGNINDEGTETYINVEYTE